MLYLCSSADQNCTYALCGCHHAKIYFQEDGICANVIRHLRIFGSPVDFNGMIYTTGYLY